MTTYLLTWNPDLWHWRDLRDNIAEVERRGHHDDTWSTGVTKKIKPDDRVFLIKLGKQEPRGIIASGRAISPVFDDQHWDKDERTKGRRALYIKVRFDTILNADKDIFPRAWLDRGIYTKMIWEPPASGRTIPDDVAKKLEKDWADFLNRRVLLKRESLGKGAEVVKKRQQSHHVGAGFGTPETNRIVEQAAVSVVTEHYKSRGWNVTSVEAEKHGFDLRCEKESAEEHVEVKGIQGKAVSFVITAGEVKRARTDKRFVLCVVTSATSRHPRLTSYRTEDLINKFDLTPLTFRASLRA